MGQKSKTKKLQTFQSEKDCGFIIHSFREIQRNEDSLKNIWGSDTIFWGDLGLRLLLPFFFASIFVIDIINEEKQSP
jgi:hypothetical protein